MGGYAYTRDLTNIKTIYLRYENIEHFYKKFKERYNAGNDNLYVPAVPTIGKKRIELNEKNYEVFYKVGDEVFLKMSEIGKNINITDNSSIEEIKSKLISFIQKSNKKSINKM